MKTLVITFGMVLSACVMHAQSDPAYRQNQFNAMVLNPAQTGANERNQIVVDANKSWVGIEGTPKTISATGNFNLTDQLGIGFTAVNDELNSEQETIRANVLNFVFISSGIFAGWKNPARKKRINNGKFYCFQIRVCL